MSQKWSRQLASQFELRLPHDVVEWFDAEVWRQESVTPFGMPAWPESVAGSIWGGQMLPDTLPILGNCGGDYLCLRIADDGTASEVIRWLHEGGLWTSYGDTLAEALVFDAAVSQMEADPADEDEGALPFLDWALERAGNGAQAGTCRQALGPDGGLSLEGLLHLGLAECAVRWKLSERSCMSGLEKYCRRTEGSERLAARLRVARSELDRSMFDSALFPDTLKVRLAKVTGKPIEELLYQDWEGANRNAEHVIRRRTDLSWPFAVAGWAAERKGNRSLALELYRAGAHALGSAAEFTEAWGLPAGQGHTKFVIDRLYELRDELPADFAKDSYLQTALGASTGVQRFDRIRGYWLEHAEQAEREGCYDHAYWGYYHAGWDLFCTDDMEMILERLQRAAAAAGWRALALLAAQHRRCLAR
jgi:hypothetical protein